MRLRLHHAHEARSMRVLWLLQEIGADHELVVHDFFDKSLRSEDYLALNPAGRVPTLEVDGTPMCESGAIIEFLCETFPQAGLGRTVGDPERMEWLDWLHYAETLGQHCANLTQSHIVLYQPWMRSPTQMSLETKRMAKVLGRIEARLADGRDWLLSSGFSAVDCAVGYGVWVAQRFVSFETMPRLAAYAERLFARPAFLAALPPDGARLIYRQEFYDLPAIVEPAV